MVYQCCILSDISGDTYVNHANEGLRGLEDLNAFGTCQGSARGEGNEDNVVDGALGNISANFQEIRDSQPEDLAGFHFDVKKSATL